MSAGKTLMPGLIDAHCHVLGSSLKVTDTETQPLTYVAGYASKMLGHALDCGFTTLRDVGGGDAGIARAVEDRLIKGPRVFFAGRVLSMTGGHGDFRDPFSAIGACGCSADGRVAVIWTGRMRCVRQPGRNCAAARIASRSCSPAVFYRRPIRSGWINSTDAEYRPRSKRPPGGANMWPLIAIRRAPSKERRDWESGPLNMQRSSTRRVRPPSKRRVRMWYRPRSSSVPCSRMQSRPAAGMGEPKLKEVSDSSLRGLEIMDRQGLKIGFGTDLLGHLHIPPSP